MAQRILQLRDTDIKTKEEAKQKIKEYIDDVTNDIHNFDIVVATYYPSVHFVLANYVVAIVSTSPAFQGNLRIATFLGEDEFNVVDIVSAYYPDGKTFLEDWDISDVDKRINPNQYEFVKEIDMSKPNIFLFNTLYGVDYKMFDNNSKLAFRKTVKYADGYTHDVYVWYRYDAIAQKATYYGYFRTEYGIPSVLKKVFDDENSVSKQEFKYHKRLAKAKQYKQLSIDFASWQKPYIHFGDVALLTQRQPMLEHFKHFDGNIINELRNVVIEPLLEIKMKDIQFDENNKILTIFFNSKEIEHMGVNFFIYQKQSHLVKPLFVVDSNDVVSNPTKSIPLSLSASMFEIYGSEARAAVRLKTKKLSFQTDNEFEDFKKSIHMFRPITLHWDKSGTVIHNKKVVAPYNASTLNLNRTNIDTAHSKWFNIKKDSLLVNPIEYEPKRNETLTNSFQNLKYQNVSHPFTLLDLARGVQDKLYSVYFKHQKGIIQMRANSKGQESFDLRQRRWNTTLWTRVCYNRFGLPKSTLRVEHDGKLKQISHFNSTNDTYLNDYDFIMQGICFTDEFLYTILRSFYHKMFRGLRVLQDIRTDKYYIDGSDLKKYNNFPKSDLTTEDLQYIDIIVAEKYDCDKHTGEQHHFKTNEHTTCYKFRLKINNSVREIMKRCLADVQDAGPEGSRPSSEWVRNEATEMFINKMIENIINRPQIFKLKFVEEVHHPNKKGY